MPALLSSRMPHANVLLGISVQTVRFNVLACSIRRKVHPQVVLLLREVLWSAHAMAMAIVIQQTARASVSTRMRGRPASICAPPRMHCHAAAFVAHAQMVATLSVCLVGVGEYT